MSAKEAVLELVRKMPDDVTTEDIAYAVHVRARIEEAIRQADSGESISNEEAKRRFAKWLA